MNEIKYSRFDLHSIFSEVKRGDYHASSHLEKGSIPLISCKTEDHGVEGWFDIPLDDTYTDVVTIACDGTPLTSFYHPYRFAAKDNILVCTPNEGIKASTIYYAIAYLNKERWRFSYGRKCYENKVGKVSILFPINDYGEIDQTMIENILKEKKMNDFIPKKRETQKITPISIINFKRIPITDLFILKSGDYHNASSLPEGTIPLISCGEKNNGVIRQCSVPEDKIYENTLTIAYNGQPLTTKYHPYRFAAKDDVAICIPIKELKESTFIYLQFILNRQRWRYSYGRKCFREKMERQQLFVPLNTKGEIDEENIEKIVSNTNYWDYLIGTVGSDEYLS